jgi:acyl-CoA thioester hydrolase
MTKNNNNEKEYDGNRTERMLHPAGLSEPGSGKLVAVPGFKLTVPVEVRFRDTDAMGHVNNACYLTYCETARAHYWKFLFGTRNYREVGFILANAVIDFRSPCFSGETLMVGIKTAALGRTSFSTHYQIRERDTGRLVADAQSVQVMYDYKKEIKIPVSKEIRAVIARFEGLPEAK